jgi:hypothetical protein
MMSRSTGLSGWGFDQTRDNWRSQTFDGRVADLRDQKIRSANAAQLAPSGMRPPPYLGDIGHLRAENEAKAQIQTLDKDYLKQVAKGHNGQIDKRLDAQRENQAAAEPERASATKSPAPNRSPRFGTVDRRAAGPAHPPRPHSGDERRELPPEAEQTQARLTAELLIRRPPASTAAR